MLYRSAQLDASSLTAAIKEYGIRTVINLRGEDTDDSYIAEPKASDEAAVKHIDFGLSSGDDLSDQQLD